MANELSLQVSLSLLNGNLKLSENDSITIDQASALGGNPGTVSVGTSEEVVALGDIVTLGYCFIKNLDATNYVTYGPEAAGAMAAMGRLKAGEFTILRLEPGITLRAQANTASCDVRFNVLSD